MIVLTPVAGTAAVCFEASVSASAYASEAATALEMTWHIAAGPPTSVAAVSP